MLRHLKDLAGRLSGFSSSLELGKGFKFIISILTLYTLFWLVFQVTGLVPLKNFTAWASSGLLELSGISNSVLYGQVPVISLSGVQAVKASIVDLCVGDIELALLPAIILSTFDRSIRKRIIGTVVGIAMIVLVNPLRIFLVLGSGKWFGWRAAEFIHSFTFRLILILIILGFYYIWYLEYDRIKGIVDGFIERIGQ